MAGPLDGKRIAILATHGFEQSELEVPRDRLTSAGAKVEIVSPEQGEIKGWDLKDWGRPGAGRQGAEFSASRRLRRHRAARGQINPDLLRANADALKLIKAIYDGGKTVAAICHGPWLLIETGIAKGKKMTSYHSIKTDVTNASATWEDSSVVTDNGVITSRNPGDLEDFSNKIIEEIRESRHQRRAA